MLVLFLSLAFQAPPSVHLSDLLREAREHNPELRAALAEVRAAKAAISPAGAFDDPVLMLQLWNGPADFSSVPLMVQVSENVPLGGKRARRREAAEADYNSRRADAATKVRDVEQEVARTYFELFMIDRTLEVDREIERIASSMIEAALARISSGKGEVVEQLRAQAELLKVQADEETAQAQRTSHNAHLATLLNRDPDEPVGATGIPALLTSMEPEGVLRARGLEQRPEIAAADAAIAAAEAQRRLAEAARVPDLGFSAAEMHQFGGSPGEHDFLFLGVQGNLPLFEGEKNHPRVEATLAHADAMQSAAQAIRNRVLAEIADAYARVAAESRLIELHHRLVPLSREAYQSSIASYGAGRSDFLLVLDSARDLQMHELDLAAHLGAYEQDLADLEHAVGGDLGLVAHAEGGHLETH